MKITSFSNYVEQLSLAWQFASTNSPADITLNASKQDRGEKKWSVPHHIKVFNVLNNEVVAGFIGLVPAHLPGSHFLDQYAQPWLPLLCFRSMQFLKTNISQGSVATPLDVMDL